MLIAARQGSPLALGYGDGEMNLGSDALALAPLTRRIAYLKDGDWTVVDRRGARFYDIDGQEVQRLEFLREETDPSGTFDDGCHQLIAASRAVEVDAAARSTLVAAGYPEPMYALGHQLGRSAHDGGTTLAPRCDRYGSTMKV